MSSLAMALAKTNPLFLVLLVWIQAVSAQVEPPTNVTLHCHNLDNVLQWSYDQLSPGLKFKVDISSILSEARVVWVDSPTVQADVSFLSDPVDEYFVTVTAVVGQNESDVAPPDGLTFSYFEDTLTSQKCSLDFPSVNVTQQDDTILFRFTHPWLLYHQKFPDLPNTKGKKEERKKGPFAQISDRLPVFLYEVEIVNQSLSHHSFTCEESVCKEKLPVEAAQGKHCLTVKGKLKKVAVLQAQEYCSRPVTPPHQSYISIIIVSIVLAVIAFAVTIYMVYRKITDPSSSLPEFLDITNKLKQLTLGPDHEHVSVPELGPSSPTPLLPNTEENKLLTNDPSSTEPELRLRIGGVWTEVEGVCDVVQGEKDEDPGYVQGSNLDEEIQNFSKGHSGYESRPVFVEIAPDEQAEGYRGGEGGTGVL